MDCGDWFVFMLLEFLAVFGFAGNLILLIIIFRSHLIGHPSFLLVISLISADIFHCLTTSLYFYPPILCPKNFDTDTIVGEANFTMKFFNFIDWTAWSVTLTHMSAICLDRFAALTFLQYSHLVTVRKSLIFTLTVWSLSLLINFWLISSEKCCLMIPLPDMKSFGFKTQMDEKNSTISAEKSNVFRNLYAPLEIGALIILVVFSPMTLMQLRKRVNRKRSRTGKVEQFRNRLLEQSVTSQDSIINNSADPPSFSAKDIKIFVQIVGVSLIFFAYIFVYYSFFYIQKVKINRSLAILNSFLFSICNAVNPIIYFVFNEQIRRQLNILVKICLLGKPRSIRLFKRSSEIDPLLDFVNKKQKKKLSINDRSTSPPPLFYDMVTFAARNNSQDQENDDEEIITTCVMTDV
uniref:G-protein coupled receptors family 1 profile domain-containing protein n=1 Tax=Romanomermis culicivorax TaxID=13658 RepID=A0A915J0M4_ROMCU